MALLPGQPARTGKVGSVGKSTPTRICIRRVRRVIEAAPHCDLDGYSNGQAANHPSLPLLCLPSSPSLCMSLVLSLVFILFLSFLLVCYYSIPYLFLLLVCYCFLPLIFLPLSIKIFFIMFPLTVFFFVFSYLVLCFVFFLPLLFLYSFALSSFILCLSDLLLSSLYSVPSSVFLLVKILSKLIYFLLS